MDSVKVSEADLAAGVEGVKPLYVGLALFCFFPLGFYLLKNHPVLSQNKKWWAVGAVWTILGGWFVALYAGIFMICLSPILVPLAYFLRKKNPNMTLDGFLDVHLKNTSRKVGSVVASRATRDTSKLKTYFKSLVEDENSPPEKVALWLFFCFPLGLYLLWKHPVLSHDKRWWRIGGAWSAIIIVGAFLAAINEERMKNSSNGNSVGQSPFARSTRPQTERAVSSTAAARSTPQSDAYKKGFKEGRKFGSELRAVRARQGQPFTEDEIRGLNPSAWAAETGISLPYPEGTKAREEWVDGYNDGLREGKIDPE